MSPLLVGLAFASGAERPTENYQRVVLQLDQMPLSTLNCAVLTEKGAQQTVSFGPDLGPILSREVIADTSSGVTVSCWSEPYLFPPATRTGSNGDPRDCGLRASGEGEGQIPGTIELTPRMENGSTCPLLDAELAVVFKDLADATEIGEMLGSPTGTALAGGRSLLDGTPPALVSDTLDILADIAVERARKAGSRVIGGTVEDLVCEELGERLAEALTSDKTNSRWKAPLPRTCTLVSGLDLEQMAASGSEITTAIEQDLVELILRLAARDGMPSAPVADLLAIVQRVVQQTSTGTLSRTRVLRELSALAAVDMTDVKKEWSDETACAVEVGFAAASMCAASASCDLRGLHQIALNPSHFMRLPQKCSSLDDELVDQVAFRAWEIVRSPDTQSPRDTARTLVGLVFEVAMAEADEDENAITAIRHLADLADAVLVEDQRTAVAAGFDFVGDVMRSSCNKQTSPTARCLHAMQTVDRLAPLLEGLGANAQSLKAAAADPAQAESLRANRKETLEALIDASTRRDHRQGDMIFSLGARPTVVASELVAYGVEGEGQGLPPIMVPAGVAVDWVARQTTDPKRFVPQERFGLHVGLEVLDLTAYLSEDALEAVAKGGEPTAPIWNDILQPTVSAGLVAWNGLVVGGQVTLRPYACDGGPCTGSDLIAPGATISWYVPFFDFN